MPEHVKFELVVIGTSTGGLQALKLLLGGLPADFSAALAIVQHIPATSDNGWATLLGTYCALPVKEADEKERILGGNVYVAPANYHLLVEPDGTFSLTVDELVNYARPAVDVLFETAAESYGPKVIGIVLTGANSDGAQGLRRIREKGGLAVAQDPATAEASAMPAAAIRIAQPQLVLSIDEIRELLLGIHQGQRSFSRS